MTIVEQQTGYPDQAARDQTVLTQGWHPDPLGHHKLRFHDGAGWTDHVTHYGPTPCAGCTVDQP